jgi:hypothetical protein
MPRLLLAFFSDINQFRRCPAQASEAAITTGVLSPFAGDVSGKQAIRAYLSKGLLSVKEWTFEIHDIVGNEEHTVVLGRNDVRFTNGQVLRGLLSTEIFHVDDEGLARDVWTIFDTDRWRKALAGTG